MVEAIVLCGILSLSIYMAMLPRLGYPFPLHVDEWIHLSWMQWLLDSGRATFPDPYAGGRQVLSGNMEPGYQVWLGELLYATGL